MVSLPLQTKKQLRKKKEIKESKENGTEAADVIFNNNHNKTHTHRVTATIFSYQIF